LVPEALVARMYLYGTVSLLFSLSRQENLLKHRIGWGDISKYLTRGNSLSSLDLKLVVRHDIVAALATETPITTEI